MSDAVEAVAPLNEKELDECRAIGPLTGTGAISVGRPSMVVARLIATIDALRAENERLAKFRHHEHNVLAHIATCIDIRHANELAQRALDQPTERPQAVQKES